MAKKKGKKVYNIKIETSSYKLRKHMAIMAKIVINGKQITHSLFHQKGGPRSYGYVTKGDWQYYSGKKRMMKDLLDFIKNTVET